EARAMLALAMRNLKTMDAEQAQLLKEIDTPLAESAFDPETFSSTTREEAIRALAFAVIKPAGAGGKAVEGMNKRIDDFLDDSGRLSTQENFWLLMAFKALHPPSPAQAVDFRKAQPAPAAVSRNGQSALWQTADIRHIRDFAVRADHADALTCLVQAQYRSDSPVTNRADKGFRVERVVKDLTDKTRLGTAEAPYKLGDQLQITYRIVAPKEQFYVALEDELPAAIETINPAVNTSGGAPAPMPLGEGEGDLDLSYSELRDRTTCLYFNTVEPGVGIYSVQARVTCAGVFRWPATQVEPMYDTRFSGVSPSGLCHVSGD
ncbi:MAG TPA: hypothetical protein VG733_11910, partial [Chthoniobacteraceae bacterium]|nr:hypothetical protein [Chthoniobacteraceae bacterium]